VIKRLWFAGKVALGSKEMLRYADYYVSRISMRQTTTENRMVSDEKKAGRKIV